MKKLLIVGSLMFSLSCLNPAHAVDPVTTGIAAAGAAKAASGAAAAAATVVGAGTATAIGTPVVGILGGFGAAVAINEYRFDNCQQDKKACEAAKIGTYTGAGVGTAGVLTAVAIAGPNLLGLASIGSAVGGGVIAGAATLIAAPIIAAAAAGYGTYWYFNRENK